MQKGELTRWVNDQQVTFNVLNAMKSPNQVEDCNFINVVDFATTKKLNSCYSKEEINTVTFEEFEDKDPKAADIAWSEEKQPIRDDNHFESLNLSNREVKSYVPFIKSPHVLELKHLPLHLKYVYLGDNKTLSVIISSSLKTDQENSLVDILERYNKAIGWTIAQIKGISPSICRHKLLLEDCNNNSI